MASSRQAASEATATARLPEFRQHTKRAAGQWLAGVETEILQQDWRAPESGDVPLQECAEVWVAERRLQQRTRELYAGLLRNHINPHLRDRRLDQVKPPLIRGWRTRLIETGVSETVAAKAYRLLRAILNTAVRDDRLIRENPCRIRGFDREHAPERPTANIT